MKKVLIVTAVLLCGVGVANATITLSAEGTSGKGTDVSVEAQLTLSGDTLTVVLANTSSGASLHPDDLLSSFYFDIANGDGLRPTLTYASATGDTYEGIMGGADRQDGTDADLQAFNRGDDSWQFKTLDASLNPFVGFGIGTVGNSDLSPNGFNGNIVGGMNYGIYTGDIESQNLMTKNAKDPLLLVKETAAFTFSGLTGFTEDDIVQDGYAFGLGTAPDSLLVPEPATLALLGLGGLLIRRKK